MADGAKRENEGGFAKFSNRIIYAKVRRRGEIIDLSIDGVSMADWRHDYVIVL